MIQFVQNTLPLHFYFSKYTSKLSHHWRKRPLVPAIRKRPLPITTVLFIILHCERTLKRIPAESDACASVAVNFV